MAHPFEKLFEQALRKSNPDHNEVVTAVNKLVLRGYPETEIYGVLLKLEKSLISDTDALIVHEARSILPKPEDE